MAARGVRISGGSARGVPLVEPRGVRLRPTSGLVREAIFNILADRVTGARVLDLYAGTGALGVEALSRGAASAPSSKVKRAPSRPSSRASPARASPPPAP
jgi:16S rRNA (guanine966-N2)-methyltransferase